MELKKCSHCKIKKSLYKFNKSVNRYDGLDNNCKDCVTIFHKIYYINHRLEVLKHQSTPKYRKRKQLLRKINYKARYREYKAEAKRKGIKFNLDFDMFQSLVSTVCFYCGNNKFNGIDRLNSKKGYIKNNMVACCWGCNRMKNILTITQFVDKVNKIYKYYGANHAL